MTLLSNLLPSVFRDALVVRSQLVPSGENASMYRSASDSVRNLRLGAFHSLRSLIVLGLMSMSLTGCGLLGNPHELGQEAMEKQDYGTAVEAYSRVIDGCLKKEKASDCEFVVIALINRALAKSGQMEYLEAARDLGVALEHVEDDDDERRAEILNNRGVAYLNSRSGKREEALEDLDAAIELRPDYAEAFANRCRIQLDLEYFEEAIDDCKQAVEMDKSLAEAFGNMALAFQEQGDDENAIRNYTTAIMMSGDAQALFNRGMLRYALGCFDLAFNDFLEITETSPDTDYLHYMASQQRMFLENRPPSSEQDCLGLEHDGEYIDLSLSDAETAGDEADLDASASDDSGDEASEEVSDESNDSDSKDSSDG